MSIQRANIGFTPGAGFFVPLTGGAAASISIRPPAILNLVELQVLGASSDSFTLQVPAIAAGDMVDVPYNYKPAGSAINFSLVAGASGIIYADIFFPVLPVGCGVLGFSKSLVFAIGPPQNPGSALWVLQPRQTYQAMSIQGSIRFFSPAGCDAQSVVVGGFAAIICKPPVVTS